MVQSNLFKPDLFKRDFGLSGTLPFAVSNPIFIQVTMVKRDFALSGTVKLWFCRLLERDPTVPSLVGLKGSSSTLLPSCLKNRSNKLLDRQNTRECYNSRRVVVDGRAVAVAHWGVLVL
jgi:hypothetical protein